MRIDFYVYTPQDVLAWEPIWSKLVQGGVDASFVLEPPGHHVADDRDFQTEERGRLVPLMTPALFRESSALLASRGHPYLDQGRYDADAAVTTRGPEWLGRYRGLKLRTVSGCSAVRSAASQSEMNAAFDGVFVPGEHDRERIARWLRAEDVLVIGHPRFAAFQRRDVDRAEWQRHFHLDPAKKTVVYLPTWGAGSSLGRFQGVIAGLGVRHDVVCKPHPYSRFFEPGRYEVLRDAPGVWVEEDEPDILPLLAVADVVLSDVRSAALSEAFLIDRPTLALSPHGNAIEDDVMDGLAQAAPICPAPEDLPQLVAGALEADTCARGRRLLAARLFALDARDDAIAAEEIIRLVHRKQTQPEEAARPFLRV